jgi:hypothetical protein
LLGSATEVIAVSVTTDRVYVIVAVRRAIVVGAALGEEDALLQIGPLLRVQSAPLRHSAQVHGLLFGQSGPATQNGRLSSQSKPAAHPVQRFSTQR